MLTIAYLVPRRNAQPALHVITTPNPTAAWATWYALRQSKAVRNPKLWRGAELIAGH